MRLPRPLFLALRTTLYLVLCLLLVRGAASFLPKQPPPVAKQEQAAKPPDPPGLQGLPALFATEYLTWDAANPTERAARLVPYILPGLDPQAGWHPGPAPGRQTVMGAWTLATQPAGPGRWLATVAARVQTEPALAKEAASRTLYLSLPLVLTESGTLAIAGPPALLPQPLATGAPAQPVAGDPVKDDRADALLPIFFSAYFSGADTSYFLLPGRRLDPGPTGFALKEVGKAELLRQDGRLLSSVQVTVQERASGATFTFRYTLELAERDGRLYIQDLLQKGA
jgi:hypothetical protein